MDVNVPAEPPQLLVKTGPQDGEISRRRKSISDRTTHTKKLSLNFPVLLPPHTNGTSQSPNTSTPISPARSSPRTAASPAVEAADFLTLLAGQERKVLELREELGKAENELLALKRQWASFEASKKKSELRQIAKLQPLPSGTGRDDSETERERQWILEQTSGKPRRHTSQRVFSSSRHARQLSLLSPTSGEKPTIRHSLDSNITSSQTNDPEPQPPPPSVDTIPTSTFESSQTLGKTYRDLANRNSLPPPSTDAIMRQGKQMASDLKDGLWTFFEDIRQATVGEEAITGVQGENSRPKMATRSSNTLHRKKRFSKDNTDNNNKRLHPEMDVDDQDPTSTSTSTTIPQDTNFWREFGVETPHKPPHSQGINTNTNRQVSDPLLDLDDEAWDTWESPHPHPNPRIHPIVPASKTTASPQDSQMPWPELSKRLTPARLTRTVSDMMKEWDVDPGTGEGMEGQAGQDHHVLTSPHM
jgi:hypothetical protein